MFRAAIVLSVLLEAGALVSAQATRKPVKKAPPPAPPVKTAADLTCPTPLGVGVKTKVAFCDVMAGRDPAAGILIKFPPHTGTVALSFDLSNRETYSEELVRTNRAYARYTATVGVLTMDNTLISRATVQSEFRKASDLIDRIGGGAGPAGVKAVAPTGLEPITITVPEGEDQVSILGEKVSVERPDGNATYTSDGRPIAIISNVMVEYRPAPPKPVKKKAR